jgi:hypothetical protein
MLAQRRVGMRRGGCMMALSERRRSGRWIHQGNLRDWQREWMPRFRRRRLETFPVRKRVRVSLPRGVSGPVRGGRRTGVRGESANGARDS